MSGTGDIGALIRTIIKVVLIILVPIAVVLGGMVMVWMWVWRDGFM